MPTTPSPTTRSPASGHAEVKCHAPVNQPRTFERPNVLLLYTDQQRRDSVGCYGSRFASTPHLDALAADGRRFDRCYVQSPVCVPSRFAFLTGRYCSSTGVGGNGPEFPSDLTPVNRLLSPYGYHGAQIGKLHFVPHSNRDHRDPTPELRVRHLHPVGRAGLLRRCLHPLGGAGGTRPVGSTFAPLCRRRQSRDLRSCPTTLPPAAIPTNRTCSRRTRT